LQNQNWSMDPVLDSTRRLFQHLPGEGLWMAAHPR